MSTLLDKKPRTRSGAGGTVLGATLPQVNLLPPEVRAARGLRTVKRWLGISLILTVVLCLAAFGLALVSGASAASELLDAQNETTRLQQEQQKYAEVPQVLGALDQAETARKLGMSTEVEWKKYLDALTSVLPANTNIDTFTVSGATPSTPAAAAADPLQGSSVGQIQFTGRATTVPDTAAWIDALNSIPGFSGAWVTTVAVTEDEHSGTYYAVTGTVQYTEAAYAHRFAAAAEGEG